MSHKYLAAISAIAIALVGALTQLTGPFTWATVIQLALLGINSVVIYAVPLTSSVLQQRAKTVAAVVVAVLTALTPFVVPGHPITTANVALVILAGLQALASHVGVQARLDAAGAGR